MKTLLKVAIVCLLSSSHWAMAQDADAIIEAIQKEANENSQLERLAHELLDVIGPRLVGTPEMQQSHDWVVNTYKEWGILAENEKWGEWKGWQRGISHIDLIAPRVKTLQGMQLAWSPSTSSKGITGEVILLADVTDSDAFAEWLPNVKGKFVLTSMLQPTGRPDDNWEEYATEDSFNKMKEARDAQKQATWERYGKIGYSWRMLPGVLEDAGAIGFVQSYWSNGFGANKIFSARTKKTPTVDLSLEDYGLVYRLAEYGDKPVLRVKTESKETGVSGTFNTIATIKGSELPDEYIILSAHLDSWDGAAGATDNGTGTIIMMETLRILKKIYPNPKRTILVGHWGSEEQGLNGSRAFVEDHPEIVENIQAVFNQDDGTGRVVSLSGAGFLRAHDFLGRWLSKVPEEISDQIETDFPGTPTSGGSDDASFVAAGVPAFSLASLSWDYWDYTWHTNLDTYDKIVFDDVRNTVILTAVLTYMASEDDEKSSREKIDFPISERTGKQGTWPKQKSPNRRGGLD